MATICGRDQWDLRNAGLEELQLYLCDKGLADEAAERLCQPVRLDRHWFTRVTEPVVAVQVDLEPEIESVESEAVAEETRC